MIRLVLAAALLATAAPAFAQDAAAPVLASTEAYRAMAAEGAHAPLFARELASAKRAVEAGMRAGIDVPVPKDRGGGPTHERHKDNYKLIQLAGTLYRVTGDKSYADYVRDMLLAYAKLYPGLGKHPAAANQVPGRLFWQSLNDSVWLVHAIQGYDAVRGDLTPAERKTIDDDVFRRMAAFLTSEPATFDRIHNHSTWANAGVGMTGYVLRDKVLVEQALKGSDRSGKVGFLRQLDLLFSPDGYYAEGPYYQRYALQPFVVFAQAIADNEPSRKIFDYRDGIVLKAIRTAVQTTYAGYFFPINDAMPDKSLKTEELYQGVAIGYAASGDAGLLGIARWQGKVALSPQGFAVARDIAAGKAKPFAFASTLLRDGPEGKDGALAILRSGPDEKAQVVVAKNTAQGMGHGHFDKLNWLLYDNGNAIVTDYGAARFLNIEAKDGGRYLPENDSWAQQTIAHNTLVVNETSHFETRLAPAEKVAPVQLAFKGEGPARWSIGEMAGAYPGVTFRRGLVQIETGKGSPLVLDLLTVKNAGKATYDLPLHFAGHIIDTDLKLASNVAARPVLGKANGYQHLWVDATAALANGQGRVTWITDGRFYTYRMATAGAQVILAESGANDPRFNLRREPVVIQRIEGAGDAAFLSLIEPHGRYDAATETTTNSRSAVTGLTVAEAGGARIATIALVGGKQILVAIAADTTADKAHSVTVSGRKLEWRGPVGRFDGEASK
ncbi:heparinase II/III family protein [Sphingomonas sp. BT-65]|uniref:alginate lyase family protein n=1 Tax=Sphingomonas sp. BT-65 TaxID=2989821 RepID=UPI002235B354|nr:alginate lyase family protein [Sphingomonas sp. BT-65]MCW4462092.1 heparinase II/III family protein [Sphingomonas sp. BT-65]